MSMASEAAAAARRKAASITDYYNLKLGPTAWKFSGGLGLDYNDNVNYTADQPEGDFIFRPQISTGMLLPVTDQNSLSLTLNAGYSAYAQHTELNRLFIPGSEVSFDLYAGDIWINLHDRFSLTEYSYQDPTVAGTGDYAQFQNALGTTVIWDLNKAILRFGYDHLNYITLAGTQGQQPDGQSEVVSLAAGYAPKPGMLVGAELGAALFRYTDPSRIYSDASQWNAGGFCEMPVSDYIHFTGHGGYSVYSTQSSGLLAARYDLSGIYAQLDLGHRINKYVDHSLSGGRTISATLGGGTVDRYFAHWRANWRVLRKITLNTGFSYEHGSQLYTGGETYDQYGPVISLSRPITAKLSGNLGYRFYWRTSDKPGRDYSVNVVSLGLYYAF